MPQLKTTAKYLRATTVMHDGVGVDRDKGVIRGMVLAQAGPFKTLGRGEFDDKSLAAIKALANKHPKGLKSRMEHPNFAQDGSLRILGRYQNPRIDAVRVMRDGKPTTIPAVRADLQLHPVALDTPVGGGKPLGVYLMDIAETDPDLLSTSLVLEADMEYRMDKKGRPLMDNEGMELPPLWRPTKLHANDVVSTGEAVDGMLQALSACPADQLGSDASDDQDEGLSVGDKISHYHDDDAGLCHLCFGKLCKLSDDKELSTPSGKQTMKAPVALVSHDMSKGGEKGDKGPWKLVHPDELEKLDDGDEGEGDAGDMSIPPMPTANIEPPPLSATKTAHVAEMDTILAAAGVAPK